MGTLTIQDHLFNLIKEKLPPDSSLPETIAELLFISYDSAYRRLRGETLLVLEEARTLCETFGISLDKLLQMDDNTVSFHSIRVNVEEYSFDRYLEELVKKMKMLASVPGTEIIYLSKDISLFHNFYFKPLFAFRYYFWMKSILRDPAFQNTKFSIDLLPAHTEKLGRELLLLYGQVTSVEIWNTECVNSLISQIEYYREAGYINSMEDLYAIYSALEKSINHLKAQAEEGAKFLPGEIASTKKPNFQMFQNRVMLGDNTILVNMGTKRTVYLNYELLNYLVTQDVGFCENIQQNMQALIKKSTLLSIANEKQRNSFFNVLLRKLPANKKISHR